MELFPAIDIKGAKVVRLTQGDYNKVQVYSDNVAWMAHTFRKQGARNLHVVDLDGAKEGAAVNLASISEICMTEGMFVQVGGGIRDESRIVDYLSLGVARVILGTIAVRDFAFVERMVGKYGNRIAVGVDARNGKVAVSGWLEDTELDSMEFCARLRDAGVSTVIYTDISKDGKMGGTNLEAYGELQEIAGLDIIASGGISFEEELETLHAMGMYGAILGKALYEGKIDLKRALALSSGRRAE